MKNILAIVGLLVMPVFVFAVTKPSPDADLESLSYVFYLYYDNGQLFADRDYAVKYDILNEKFVQSSPPVNAYKVEIINYKSEVINSIQFDPRQGNPGLTKGKIQVKAPYASDGLRASFYNNQNQQLVTIFVSEVALCNDDGTCNSAVGETTKTCASDCRAGTPRPVATVIPTVEEGLDITMLLIYAVGGLGAIVGAWFGWKRWKKKKEESFLPPPPPPSESSSAILPPQPPIS